ncbi:LEA type 2 family protein [Pseudoxanthomonas indica]|uniref:Late embryogenesis abundant protein n=1 Tax=Pseudoxanthomonas indica TaxID=428993 RepID=A0A1T5JFF4_9GAMM|nr:LEA type 2 family protein [Pseudoxanthomonas indica]GGD58373.1 hypothetical protein GCM10007235_33400 [Pseudoxanthomonas indica]SKC50139.1 Late embryogenesis abundant protein [Pseudoxanthomonas indica]
MTRSGLLALGLLGSALLVACSSGPVRRVSEPAASIQQLTVHANGSWSIDLRLQNYSSIPMRFERAQLTLAVDGEAAGSLNATPALSVGPESADVVTVPFQPDSSARMVLADVLASRRSLPYSLEGTISATPEEGKLREFKVEGKNTLSPVPGLDGVLR